MTQSLLLVTHLQQLGIAVHQVADNHHRLYGELPVGILFLTVLTLTLAVEGGHRGSREEWTVFVIVVAFLWLAVFLYPRHRLLKLLVVEDLKVHTAQNLHQRHILCAHAQVVLQEVGIHNRTGYTHTGVTHREVALALHRSHRLSGTCKAQDLLCDICRDGVVVEILHIVSVDTEGRQSLLGVSGQHGCEIHSTRALCAVESPYSLGIIRVHVHRL